MSVRVRPIDYSDKREISTGEVRNVASLNFKSVSDGTVCDPALFGKLPAHKADKDKDYEDEYMRTATLDLTIPVLNPFLAGREAKAWKIILRPYAYLIPDIVSGKVAYNMETEEFVQGSMLGNELYHEKWLIGGQILRHLLKKVNPQETYERLLYTSYILSTYSDTICEYLADNNITLGTIKKITADDIYRNYECDGEEFVWLIDKYAYFPERDCYKEKGEFIVKELPAGSGIYKDYCTSMSEEIDESNQLQFKKQYVDVAIMAAYMRDPKQVEDQIMDYIFVLPYGYRPNIENRVDPLNKQYNKLVSLNSELFSAMEYQGHSMRTILGKYSQVVRYLTNIFIGDDSLKKYAGKSYRCLTDMLSGKYGLMRDKLQSCRVDFSGRTVITCDPYMSIKCIGIPKTMIHKLCEAGAIVKARELSKWTDENLSEFHSRKYKRELEKLAEEDAKANYLMVGRQPTLWNLGIQAFKVIPVDGNAIVLSPLVVMPFNADFDGDTMHTESAVGEAAKKELATLMASTNNLFYPKSGELTVELRHEILYGLFMASAIKDDPKSKTWSMDEIQQIREQIGGNTGLMKAIYEGVCRNIISIYDKVPAVKGYVFDPTAPAISAGVAAIKYVVGTDCSRFAIGVLPLKEYGFSYQKKVFDESKGKKVWKSVQAKDGTLTKNWFMEICSLYKVRDKDVFTRCIDNAVRLGFSVAKVWPPSISAMTDIDTKPFVEEFNKKVIEREKLLHMGIEIEEAYSSFFESELKTLNKKIAAHIEEKLGLKEDKNGDLICDRECFQNGYISMWKSGGKGSKSNLMQIFGIKGRVQKDDVNAFNTIIGNSLSIGLTGLEGFITAYGGRQGLVDKVLSTAEPGYLSRRLEHTAANWKITCEDCGTTEGIVWKYDDFLGHIDPTQLSGDPQIDYFTVQSVVSDLFVGRYVVDGEDSVYIENKKQLEKFFGKYMAALDINEREGTATLIKKKGMVVRSPITCACPCCQKCYGKDLTSNKVEARIGTPIGFIAAQSIGQPGTQLTMKNFQRGGVVSDANLTSSFDKISSYLALTDLASQKASKLTLAYDALSPKEGRVSTVSTGDGRKKILVLNEKGKNILGNANFYVDENTQLKDYVKRGDSFQAVQGDLNIREILKYRTYEDAYKYLVLILQRIFAAEAIIDLKHYETIVAAMCSFILLTDVDNHYAGEILSLIEVRSLKTDENNPALGSMTLLGIDELPKYRRDFFESMIMEDMKTYVPRAIIMNPVDELKNPKTRISFGQKINMGSNYDGFVENSNIFYVRR